VWFFLGVEGEMYHVVGVGTTWSDVPCGCWHRTDGVCYRAMRCIVQ
jgi:hypothetical protein